VEHDTADSIKNKVRRDFIATKLGAVNDLIKRF
jgi:hypothetical protein